MEIKSWAWKLKNKRDLEDLENWERKPNTENEHKKPQKSFHIDYQMPSYFLLPFFIFFVYLSLEMFVLSFLYVLGQENTKATI